MPITPIGMPHIPFSAEGVGGGDFSESFYKPRQLAENLLASRLNNEMLRFKNTPDYQQAMLAFLRGQGANLWGRASLYPAESSLHQAQAQASNLKNQALMNYMQQLKQGAPAAENELPSAEGVGFLGDVYGNATPAGYMPTANNKINQNDDEVLAANNRFYQQELATRSLLGIPAPQVEVDPLSGVRYALTSKGRIPISMGASESAKAAAEKLGAAKGTEEASYVTESPDERKDLNELQKHIKKLQEGRYDKALGWRHAIPYGLNTPLSEEQLKDFAGLEKLLTGFRTRAGNVFKGQGSVTEYERKLANANIPNPSDNPVYFKAQMEQFVKDLYGDSLRKKLIRQYKKEGMSFDEARDKAEEKINQEFPGGSANQAGMSSTPGYKNVMFDQTGQAFKQQGDRLIPTDFVDLGSINDIQQAVGPQNIKSDVLANLIRESKAFAPIAGDVAASGLMAQPNPFGKAAGALLAGGLGAYEAAPEHRIQGALQNIALAAAPGAIGKAYGKISKTGAAKEAIKATKNLFAERVEPFERISKEASKWGDLRVPEKTRDLYQNIREGVRGSKEKFSRELQDIARFNSKPTFENARKAQSALGYIERSDIDAARGDATELRRRILGSMQQHFVRHGEGGALKQFATAMKKYGESGPLLKQLSKDAEIMSEKGFLSKLKSLRDKGQLPEDMAELMKGLDRREKAANIAKGTGKVILAGGIPSAGIGLAYKIGNMFKGL